MASRILVLLLAIFAVAASQFHEVTGLGQPIPAFAGKGDEVVRAAGYAFSIWGLLYVGILAFGIYQLRRETAVTARLRWPAAAAFVLIGAWVIAAALDLVWLTVALIVAAAALLIMALRSAAWQARAGSRSDRWLAAMPLAALAGWLTVASAINIVTVLTRLDLLPEPRVAWAGLAVAVVTGLAVWFVRSTRLLAYPTLIAWGLVAVAVAEWGRHPVLAGLAALAAVISLAAGLFAARRRA